MAALLAWPAASPAIQVSGVVVFDGAETLPPAVALRFAGDAGYPERIVTLAGRTTPFRFDLPAAAYDRVDGGFSSAVAPDAFWLPGASATVRAVPRVGLFPPPPSLAADAVVFKRGVRLALPIADRAGRPFQPPRGWRSRGGQVDLGFADDVVLAPGATTIAGVDDPDDVGGELRLDYVDTFRVLRTITASFRASPPASAIGTTLSDPPVKIDATPPTVRVRRLAGRGYALFIAWERQSAVSPPRSAAYVRVGKRWRPLPESAITTVAADDPDGRLVPTGRVGMRVQSLLAGRRTVRLCAANEAGVMPAFGRCPTAVVGVAR